MSSTRTWFVSLKLFLISAGVVSVAVGANFAVPLIKQFVVNEIPVLYSVLLSWLKPPYLYVVINGIIITIAAASRFHHSESEPFIQSERLISVKTPPPSDFAALSAEIEISAVVEEPPAAVEADLVCDSEDRAVDVEPVLVNDLEVIKYVDVAETEEGDEFVISKSMHSPTPSQGIMSPEFLLPVREKPLVSSRFGHRKPIRSTPEGSRALRVARPKKQETLESTWKMITEGRHVPLARHLKKSDMWEHHELHATRNPPDEVETLKDGMDDNLPSTLLSSYPSLKARKEASLGHDELNRRVEAFIKKFNEEMRMQRQESLNQYMEMINRGV